MGLPLPHPAAPSRVAWHFSILCSVFISTTQLPTSGKVAFQLGAHVTSLSKCASLLYRVRNNQEPGKGTLGMQFSFMEFLSHGPV